MKDQVHHSKNIKLNSVTRRVRRLPLSASHFGLTKLISISDNDKFKLENILVFYCVWGTLLVAQLVEALCYKPEGRGIDSRWCQWNFSLTYSFQPHYGPGVNSASNRNEHQEYFLGGKGGRCVGLKTLLPSCAVCLKIWEPQPPGILRACQGL
jgi:hypothetical protein